MERMRQEYDRKNNSVMYVVDVVVEARAAGTDRQSGEKRG